MRGLAARPCPRMRVALPCGNIWRDWLVGPELKDQTAIDTVKAQLAGFEKFTRMVKGT
jgi:hypothetical protein